MSVSVAIAPGLLLLPLSVAVSPSPVLVKEYWTVTVHDLPGPRLVPVQVSEVVENVADPPAPDTAILSAELALPPEFFSVNVCVKVLPGLTVPKSNAPVLVVGDHHSDGGLPATATDGTSTAAAATEAAAKTTRPRSPANNKPNLRAPVKVTSITPKLLGRT